MPIETIYRCTCDLCGYSKVVEKASDFGLQLSVANPHLARDWLDRCICRACTQIITEN